MSKQIICKCSHQNCQFEQFLYAQQDKEKLYFEDQKSLDNYCIFHTPLEIKNNFGIRQNKRYNELIENYRLEAFSSKSNLDFSNVVFLDCDFKDKNMSGLDIDFTNTTFIKNVRFDNLKCKKLILKDTLFLDGGGIKNRIEDKNLDIKNLEFRPYALHSDFVIDIGGYVNEKGLLEFDKQGIIERLRFENHKIGDGKIFFIGLNADLKEANFKNMILDNVFFQNCDLKNCYFLNSKINITEFRNCYFPQNDNKKFKDDILGRKNSVASIFMVFMSFYLLDLMTQFIQINSLIENIFAIIYTLLIVSFLPIFLSSLNSLEQAISYYIRQVLDKIDKSANKKQENTVIENHKKSFNVHYCIADEKDIYKTLEAYATAKDKTNSTQKTLQQSLDSLSSSYSQLKDNFKDTDFQVSGDFFYAQRYTEILAHSKRSSNDLMMYNIHHFTNAFGESYMKPLVWLVLTLIFFAFPFTPNKDYISTSATPLFLIKNAYSIENNQESLSILHKKDYANSTDNSSSFYKSMIIEDNNSTDSKILYGYDNRYDYNPQEQYILRLDTEYPRINLIHSFSNMIYPFTPEQKRWFQNISKEAVYYSLLESILLWYFTIAFVLALWHRIKR
ncbi:MAG: pentapeptide repeat-containing protein [Arcobacteraceae bacterium]|nr:pentapeptide repeat-containing protein [Arcobacteraceae bacterium]